MVPIDDQSLLYLKDDKLERGDYPKQISRILLLEKDAPSLVVGIEGYGDLEKQLFLIL